MKIVRATMAFTDTEVLRSLGDHMVTLRASVPPGLGVPFSRFPRQ